jgi:hypothetical protein
MIAPNFELKEASDFDYLNTTNNMPVGWLDSLGASFELARQNAPTLSLLRAYDRESNRYEDQKKGEELVPLAEANKELAPMGLFVSKDEPRSYIDALKDKHMEDLERANVIQRGPSNIAAQASYFLSQLGGTQADVINFGANFVPIVGQYKFMTNVAKQGLLKARLMKGAKEAFIGNIAIEPVDHLLAKAEQRQYTMADSVQNVVLGTLVGTGLHLTFSKIGDFYKAKTGKENVYKDIAEAPVEFRQDLIKYALGRMSMNKRVNAAEFIEHTKLRANKELKLSDWLELQAKTSFNMKADLDVKLVPDNPKKISDIKEEINTRIKAKLSPDQTKELNKIKTQLTKLNAKLGLTIEQKSKDVDVNIVKNNKKLIPIIAKINKLNKAEAKIIEKGEEVALKEMLDADKTRKQGDFSVSKATLNKIIELKEIYSGKTPFENKDVADRGVNLDLNSPSETRLIEKEKFEKNNINSDARLNQSIEYELNTEDMLVPLKEIDRTKTLNVEDINKVNDEIDDIKNMLEIKNNELREDPAMAEFLDDFNKEIADLDKLVNRQDDFLKTIRAGFACVLRGR